MQNTTTQPVPLAPHTPAPYPFSETDVSDIADAMNFLLSALHCPRSVRPLMHALMGFLAGRATKASFYHFDLGRRIDKSEYVAPSEYGRYRDAVESRVRASIVKMQDWQSQWDNLPIDYTPGGKTDDGTPYPSTIKTPILLWVSDVANQVRAVEGLTEMTDRQRAETYRLVIDKMLKRKKIKRRQKPAPRAKKELNATQIYKMTATFGKKYLAKIHDDGREVTPELIDRISRHLADFWKAEYSVEGYELRPLDAEKTSARNAEDLPPYSTESVRGKNLAYMTTDESQAGGICAPVIHPVANDQIEDTPELQELDAFMSVGVDDFDMLLRDDTKPKNEAARRSLKGVTAGEVACQLPEWKVQADKHKWSLIIKPAAENIQQIDDVEPEIIPILTPYALFTKETSPGNHQVYLAFRDGDDKTSAGPRLIEGLKQMFPKSGLNAGSGGATRWAGSHNYKPSRRLPDGTYPIVTIHSTRPGRYVTPEELDAVGMLAPEREASANTAQADYRMTGRWMPDYQRCLDDAPRKADGTPDVSKADASYVTLGLLAGNTRQVMLTELSRVSKHPHRTPETYTSDTVKNVAVWLEEQHGRQYV